jgi:hypothetical protein
MIAFEVHLNGEKLCTAGLGDVGVISAILSWRGNQPYKDRTMAATAAIEFSVRGLTSPAGEHVRWADPKVQVGDEIRIRVINSDRPDAPTKL